jgi:predicted phosphodiesterase
MLASAEVQDALAEAERMAQAGRYPHRAALSRAVNEALDLDLTPAAWRGMWNRNPDTRDRIDQQLGKVAVVQRDSVSDLLIEGNVRGSVSSDEHAPFHDPKAIALACDVLKDWKPDVHIFAGDQIDFYNISRFEKNPARKFNIQDEIDQTQEEVFAPVRRALPRKRIVKVDGNHDNRLLKFLWQRPELFGLRVLQMENLLDLDKFGFDYAPRRVRFGNLLEVAHGDRVSKWPAASAKAELEKRRYAISTITGHVHRAGRFETRVLDGWVVGQENPCLCELSPEYMPDPDWQQGVTLFEIKDGALWVGAVRFTADYRAFAHGRWYA